MSDREPVFFTVREAAERVGRSPKTIERWIHDGMPVHRVTTVGGRVIRILIAERLLLAHYRGVLIRDPTRPRTPDDEGPVG